MNVSDEIKRLHELHQAGALTDAEFEQAKAKVLAAAVNLDKGRDGVNGSTEHGTDLASEFGRLRRSRSDRWLGGVCGGLAKVSNVEAWIWRLVFTLVALCGFGIGVLVYLLMWIFVPEE
ncbi:PspC domain-containing protein [Massilia sp. PWRC2]|uniref:PspC domain-containing protein n=1 Tax=Massilia sp. PWRC2 TaxID=2804626 RepID=UPI003CF48E35